MFSLHFSIEISTFFTFRLKPLLSLLPLRCSIEITTFSSFLLKRLLTFHFFIEISTYFALFYEYLCFLSLFLSLSLLVY